MGRGLVGWGRGRDEHSERTRRGRREETSGVDVVVYMNAGLISMLDEGRYMLGFFFGHLEAPRSGPRRAPGGSSRCSGSIRSIPP